MAVVYRAVQDPLGRTVAIKALKTSAAAEENVVTRFEREAKSLANLQHENIIHVYDFHQRTRRDVHRDGVRAGHRPVRPPREVRPPPLRRRRDHRDAGRPRARLRPLPRHRPPRHQAREHHDCAHRRREGHGLRHRARHELRRPHRSRHRHRHARVHVSRAGARRQARRAQRHLLASASCCTRWSRARSRSSRTRRGPRCTRSGSRSTTSARKLNPEIPRELEQHHRPAASRSSRAIAGAARSTW